MLQSLPLKVPVGLLSRAADNQPGQRLSGSLQPSQERLRRNVPGESLRRTMPNESLRRNVPGESLRRIAVSPGCHQQTLLTICELRGRRTMPFESLRMRWQLLWIALVPQGWVKSLRGFPKEPLAHRQH